MSNKFTVIVFHLKTLNEPGCYVLDCKIQIFQKKIIPDLLHLDIGYFGVADYEFHSPRAVGEAENRPHGAPTEGTFHA